MCFLRVVRKRRFLFGFCVFVFCFVKLSCGRVFFRSLYLSFLYWLISSFSFCWESFRIFSLCASFSFSFLFLSSRRCSISLSKKPFLSLEFGVFFLRLE